jgi:hypothetical protein
MAPHHFLLILTPPKSPAIQVNGSFMTLTKLTKIIFADEKIHVTMGAFPTVVPHVGRA